MICISSFSGAVFVELQIHVVSPADTFLPLIVADAMRPDLTPEEEEKAETEGKVSQKVAVLRGRGRGLDVARWLRMTSNVRLCGVSSVRVDMIALEPHCSRRRTQIIKYVRTSYYQCPEMKLL